MGYGTEQPLRLCLAQTGPSGYRRAASDGSRSSVTIAPSASRSGTADSISSLKHILKISPATRLARRGIYDGIPGILSEAKHHPRFHSRTLVRPSLCQSTHVCGTARGARMLLSRFHHMRTVQSYVRPTGAVMTAGLDEVREAGGWIKGARFVRVTGFGLSCFGISSRGSSSVVHLTCRGSPGSSSRRSCAYAATGPASIPVGSR